VQVFNEREDHIFASVIAIPNFRLTPTGKTVLTFYEVPAGQPRPVHARFYPGDEFGQEFTYPNQRTFNLSQFPDTTTTANPAVAVETLEPARSVVASVEIVPEPASVSAAPVREPLVAANEPAVLPAPVAATNMPLLASIGFFRSDPRSALAHLPNDQADEGKRCLWWPGLSFVNAEPDHPRCLAQVTSPKPQHCAVPPPIGVRAGVPRVPGRKAGAPDGTRTFPPAA